MHCFGQLWLWSNKIQPRSERNLNPSLLQRLPLGLIVFCFFYHFALHDSQAMQGTEFADRSHPKHNRLSYSAWKNSFRYLWNTGTYCLLTHIVDSSYICQNHKFTVYRMLMTLNRHVTGHQLSTCQMVMVPSQVYYICELRVDLRVFWGRIYAHQLYQCRNSTRFTQVYSNL